MKTLSQLLASFVLVFLVIAIFAVGIWWELYKFQDCERVGHTPLYCWGKLLGGK